MPALCHMRLAMACLCCVTGCRGFGLIDVVPAEETFLDAGRCTAISCRADAGVPRAADRSKPEAAPPRAADGGKPDAGEDAACTLASPRLDLLLVLDDSATMYPWWTQLHDELEQFLAEDASHGVAVGLQQFAQSCDSSQYVTPIVPIAPLPDNLSALRDAIPQSASANTSTIPALTGALQYASSWARDHRSSRVALLLMTDATPAECDAVDGDYDSAAQRAASTGFQGDPSIPTYVVGFGGLLTVGAIAIAGGTMAEMVSVTPAPGEIRAALERVRDAAAPAPGASGPCATP